LEDRNPTKNTRSGYLASGMIFEPWTSQIRSKCAKHSTVTFDNISFKEYVLIQLVEKACWSSEEGGFYRIFIPCRVSSFPLSLSYLYILSPFLSYFFSVEQHWTIAAMLRMLYYFSVVVTCIRRTSRSCLMVPALVKYNILPSSVII
jgi:hypothetical protein